MDRFIPGRFPCNLPPDTRGVRSGDAYKPLLCAGKDNKKGTAWGRFSRKTGRWVHCLSTGERKLSYLLDIFPRVLDYREQYPWVSKDFLQYVIEHENEPIPRNRLRTLDFVVTLRGPNNSLQYVVLSCKPSADLCKKEVQRRLKSEQFECAEYGWPWRLCTEKNLDAVTIKSAMQLTRWAGGIAFDDSHEQAIAVSSLVKQRNRGQTLDELLLEVCQAAGIEFNAAYALFSAAVCLGYLSIKLSDRLNNWRPVTLIM
jgi:hypothetical protein